MVACGLGDFDAFTFLSNMVFVLKVTSTLISQLFIIYNKLFILYTDRGGDVNLWVEMWLLKNPFLLFLLMFSSSFFFSLFSFLSVSMSREGLVDCRIDFQDQLSVLRGILNLIVKSLWELKLQGFCWTKSLFLSIFTYLVLFYAKVQIIKDFRNNLAVLKCPKHNQ